MKKVKKQLLLKGEGANQHVLHGDLMVEKEIKDFSKLKVTKGGLLKHEDPSGAFSKEHKTLPVKNGEWVMGKQVEYNPFKREISQVWD
jgi:hypothetical protein